jgi:hypothetical protein
VSDPSEKAVYAARALLRDWSERGGYLPSAGDLLAAAHDPALGLGRSVCLRDVIGVLQDAAEAHRAATGEKFDTVPDAPGVVARAFGSRVADD